MNSYVSKDALRSQFSMAMSSMYQSEVPLYGTLIDLVAQANNGVLNNDLQLRSTLVHTKNLSRIAQERHGAIRLGKASELFNIRRLFALMGMYPVAYYDLSVAGIPVHSTAFRPIEKAALSINPFRVFTSLLRTELIDDQCVKSQAMSLLEKREIFSNQLLQLISQSEDQNGLNQEDSAQLIDLAVNVFRWHNEALVGEDLYELLKSEHPLIADVVSFKGPHINHLTPATLDIDQVQQAMIKEGIDTKAIVEGPPTRNCPILLRQTSFKALQEVVTFIDKDSDAIVGSHTARFGEVEQRGIALTESGRALYDQLLSRVRGDILPIGDGSNASEYSERLENEFKHFPDTHRDMRELGLAYYSYTVIDESIDRSLGQGKDIDELVQLGFVRFDPILYEDFLPVSAAGIFQSNLNDTHERTVEKSNQLEFEIALGCQVSNEFDLYSNLQNKSIEYCLNYFNT